MAVAIRVEGVFREAAHAEEAVRALREQGLNRDVTLQPDFRAAAGRGAGAGEAGESAGDAGADIVAAATVLPAVPSGYAALFGDDWTGRPLRLTVTTSPRQAPEVARLLRECGAEEVDLT